MNIKERIRNFADRMAAKGWDYGRISMAIAKNLDINKRQAAFLLSSAIGASLGVAPMMNPKKSKDFIYQGYHKGAVVIDIDTEKYGLLLEDLIDRNKSVSVEWSDGRISKRRLSSLGTPNKQWADSYLRSINVRQNPIDPQGIAAWLEAAYHEEKHGIIEYEKLFNKIKDVPDYAPLKRLLKRIIKDEKRHMNALENILGF